MPHLLKWCIILTSSLLVSCGSSKLQTEGKAPEDFHLAPRSITAPTGSEFLHDIEDLELVDREAAIFTEISSGNVPDFLRTPVPIDFKETLDGTVYAIQIKVMADYLSIGSNDDHVLLPMTPILAQRLMDTLGASLPTRKLVDQVWTHASVTLTPQPIPPSEEMVTVPVFRHHYDLVQGQRESRMEGSPLGALVAGHKKDVILSNRIATLQNKVMIYGWHQSNGTPIQPLYSGHVNWYADYSHGVRAVLPTCVVNDSIMSIHDILSDPILYQLLSDEEGPMAVTRYDTSRSNYP